MSWDIDKLTMNTMKIIHDELSNVLFGFYAKDLIDLLKLLNKLVELNNINLPEPNIECNPEATIDYSWYNQNKQKALGFTIDPLMFENQSTVWMHYLNDNKNIDVYNPSDKDIIDYLICFNEN